MAQEGNTAAPTSYGIVRTIFAQIKAVISPAIANAPFFRPTPVFSALGFHRRYQSTVVYPVRALAPRAASSARLAAPTL
jgi:hypothetical protein